MSRIQIVTVLELEPDMLLRTGTDAAFLTQVLADVSTRCARAIAAERTKLEAPKIARVYLFPNEMVMVFDASGQQMPAYQGPAAEVWDKVRADAPTDAVFSGGEPLLESAVLVEPIGTIEPSITPIIKR